VILKRAVVSLLGAALLTAGVANGQPASRVTVQESFELTADAVEFESARRIYVARGNVRIVSGDTELSADWLAYSETHRRGVATGKVVYRADGDEVFAKFVEFDIENDRGILFAGRFQPDAGQFRMEGDEIIRHADDSYSFERGMFTTCQCPPGERDPWQIRAESADVEIGGYGTARNTTFEILGVPVIWLPWMIYPLKSDRETGLLFPHLGYSKRNGFEIGLPFFWAARDNLNVTLTPTWFSTRGYKADVEVEYVYGEHSEGDVTAAFVYDEKIDPHSNDDPFGRERWAVHGEQDVHMPLGLRAKSQFRFVSDNEYLNDFDDFPADEDDRFLESNAFVGRSLGGSGRFGAQVAAFYADDLQNPDDQDRDAFLLQRLPTVSATALPAPIVDSVSVLDRLIPAMDFEYSYFVPRRRAVEKYDDLSGAYYVGTQFIDTGIDAIPTPRETGFPGNPDPHRDDTTATGTGFELNGTFEEGEPLADDGHRVDLFPRLGLPFRIGDWVEAYPEVGWHQTFYDTHFQGTDERHLLTARVDLRTRLSRRFGDGLTHILEPRLGYALATDLGQNQGNNPLFVPQTAVPQQRVRQLELANVTRDDADRVSKFNGVNFGVGNRIYRDGGEDGSRLIADFYLSNQFRIDDGGFGNLYLGARAYPWDRTFLWANFGFDIEEARVSEVILQGAHTTRGGHVMRLRYRYLHDVPKFFEDFEDSSDRFDDFTEDFKRINQIGVFTRYAFTEQWAGFYRVAYSFEDTLLIKNRGGVEYMSKCRCWAAGVELGYTRSKGFEVNLMYRLLGLGDDFAGGDAGQWGLLDGI
jgi:lipopolysaccharide assembly outer membrane protein LptD (OstA)